MKNEILEKAIEIADDRLVLHKSAPEQLWVSDITDLKTEEGNCYLTMIRDAYPRKIMDYSIADNMESSTVSEALKMAIRTAVILMKSWFITPTEGYSTPVIEYVSIAKSDNIQMSMTEQSDPYENAHAERMNRTIKEEFCLDHILNGKMLTM